MALVLDMEQMPTRLIRRTANPTRIDTVPRAAYRKLKYDYNRLSQEYDNLLREYRELESLFDEAMDLIDYYQSSPDTPDTSHETEYGYHAEASCPTIGVEHAHVHIDPIGGKFRLGIKFKR